MLTLLILTPFFGAACLLLGFGGRSFTKSCAVFQLLVIGCLCATYSKSTGGYQFCYASAPLFPGTDISLSLGVDGLSLLLLLLTGLVTTLAVWFSPTPASRIRFFDACVLTISGGAIGAFASRDLFFLYAFHELALIPTFLMIGIWGYGERHSSAWKITLYLALGSFILLLGLLDLLLALPEQSRSFDLFKLQQLAGAHAIPAESQVRPWLLIMLGAAVLVSLFPFHSWAPSAYSSSPSPVAMLHAGVLKKFGAYAVIRIVVPLLPDAWNRPVLLGITGTDLILYAVLGNILYIGLVTIGQRRLDYILGYSSIMHMGYIFLGICSLNIVGMSGASLLMFSHGVTVAILFAISGYLRERQGSLDLGAFGGLAHSVPTLSVCFSLAMFASIGLPGFMNFASETLVFFGSFSDIHRDLLRYVTVAGLWGLVISAVYMLRAFRSVFLGSPVSHTSGWADLFGSSKFIIGLLLLVTLAGGLCPNIFIAYLRPSFEAALR